MEKARNNYRKRINAFVFLVSMMPELVALANVVPLSIDLVLGFFKPRLWNEREKSQLN